MARAGDSQARGWDRRHRPRPPPAFAASSQHHGAPWRPALRPVAGLSLGPEPGGACSCPQVPPFGRPHALVLPFPGTLQCSVSSPWGFPPSPPGPVGSWPQPDRTGRSPNGQRPNGQPRLPCPACGVLVRAEKPAVLPEPGAADPGGDSVPAHGDANNQESLNKHLLTGWAENPAHPGDPEGCPRGSQATGGSTVPSTSFRGLHPLTGQGWEAGRLGLLAEMEGGRLDSMSTSGSSRRQGWGRRAVAGGAGESTGTRQELQLAGQAGGDLGGPIWRSRYGDQRPLLRGEVQGPVGPRAPGGPLQ